MYTKVKVFDERGQYFIILSPTGQAIADVILESHADSILSHLNRNT